MLSEYNDFTKPLDENSYEACIQAIANADYFILLVGARVGGLYDVATRISITRREYREAYERVKTKKLKLITFVREELWIVREDRKGLETALIDSYKTQYEIDDEAIQALVNHTSSFTTDAEAVFEFLREIARVDEMKQAISGIGDLPIGNWIHPFSTLRQIIDTLRTEFRILHSLTRIALLENLKRELYSNLTNLTMKCDKQLRPTGNFYASFARQCFQGDSIDSSRMPGRYFRWLFMYVPIAGPGNKLSSQFIDQALVSGEFLEFDAPCGRYKSGEVSNAFFQLREDIGRLRLLEQSFETPRVDFLRKYGPGIMSESEVSVSNMELTYPFAIYDCEQNIVSLSIALVKLLDGEGEALKNVTINPTSPLVNEAAKIKEEEVTIEDVAAWIKTQ